jgi:hypothetical protein
MPWELNGNAGIGANNFLGTRNNAALIIKTNTNNAPANLEEVIRFTPSSGTQRGSVGIGTANPQRRLHVEDTEIHSGGSVAGLSFGNRETPQFVNGPGAGERWVWYATGGTARLWSGNDKVTVNLAGGIFTPGGKSFRIDHPLDPEHRFLIHACLEGPETAVYYRGQGRLEGGQARVELPDYFEALARPDGRTVVLTSCCEDNEPISVLAASGIVNGAFNVRAADDRNPRQPFYWEVKAVRADIEPLETEENKAEGRSATARGLASVGATGD